MLRNSRVVGSQMELRSCQRSRSSLRSSTTRVTSVPASAPAIERSPEGPAGQDDDQRHEDQQQEQQADPLNGLQRLAGRGLNLRTVRRDVDADVEQAAVRLLLLKRLGIELNDRRRQGQVRRRREVVVDEPVVDLVRQLMVDHLTDACRVIASSSSSGALASTTCRISAARARLLERRRERVDELVGQLADEADGVAEQVGAPADLEASASSGRASGRGGRRPRPRRR